MSKQQKNILMMQFLFVFFDLTKTANFLLKMLMSAKVKGYIM